MVFSRTTLWKPPILAKIGKPCYWALSSVTVMRAGKTKRSAALEKVNSVSSFHFAVEFNVGIES